MPYPNEHAARMRNPGDFEEGSFRRVNDKMGPGIDAIFGRLKGETSLTIQALRFDAARYSAAEARKWLADHDMKPVSFEAAKEGKALGDEMDAPEMIIKELLDDEVGILCKTVNKENRTLNAVITTSTRDRQGDIVEPLGLDFRNYMKNPVVPWAHDYSQPPVAKMISFQVSPREVTATLQFADTKFAKEIYKLYDEGFLSAFSIGFISKKAMPHADAEGNAQRGMMGQRILEAEVVEVSAVPVPANPEALRKAMEGMSDETKSLYTKALQDVVQKEGRILSTANRKRISTVLENLNALSTELKALLEETDPSQKAKKEAGSCPKEGCGWEGEMPEDGKCPKCGAALKTPKESEAKPKYFLAEGAWALADGREVRKTAFSKSIAEAVTAGKIPTEIGEQTGLEFEIVKATEKEITEAKIIRIVVALKAQEKSEPAPSSSDPEADSRKKAADRMRLRREVLAIQTRLVNLSY